MFPNNEFEITLVTYAEYDYRRWFTLSVHWGDYLLYYATQWKGPIVVVYYYNASSLSEKERLTTESRFSTQPSFGSLRVLVSCNSHQHAQEHRHLQGHHNPFHCRGRESSSVESVSFDCLI